MPRASLCDEVGKLKMQRRAVPSQDRMAGGKQGPADLTSSFSRGRRAKGPANPEGDMGGAWNRNLLRVNSQRGNGTRKWSLGP